MCSNVFVPHMFLLFSFLSCHKEEEEDEDEFPFNISDFVTVDEVGDVTDLPSPVPMEAMEDVGGASEEVPFSLLMCSG